MTHPKHTKDILQSLWSRENAVADFIPYQHHVDAQTIKTKAGDYLSIFRLEGIPFESLSAEDLEIFKEQLNLLWRNVASPHLSLWTHLIRREHKETLDNMSFEAGFDADLHHKYQAKMAEKKMMVNELYLSVGYRPHLMPQTKSWRFWHASPQETAVQDMHHRRVFQDILLTLQKGLEVYQPVLLTTYTELNTESNSERGIVYSHMLSFLNFLVNGQWCKRPVSHYPIAESLASVRPLFGADDFELRGITDSLYGGCLGICDYPEQTHAGFLKDLLSVPFSFILTQSFQFLSQTLSTELLERQRNRLQTTQDHALSQIDAMEEALDDLTSHRLVFGEHHFVLTLLAQNRLALRHAMAEASALLMESAIMVVREDWALAGAYWSQLPLNHVYRPRPAPITSRNFACLTGFQNYPRGKKHHNQWGDAVTMFQTMGNGAYYFNFHEASRAGTHHKALGNSLIIGPSGSGKTVLQGFLMSQSRKFRPKQVVFDKDRGLEIYIRASGGSYFPLHYGKPTGFNPFLLEDNPANRLFLQDFLKVLCGKKLSLLEEQALEHAIIAVNNTYYACWD